MTEQTALEKTREKAMTGKQRTMTTLANLLNDPASQKKMAAAAPKYLDMEALTRVALTAVQKNEKLMQVSAGSILQACMDCAAYGLIPNSMTNEAHLVPFAGQCVLVVGYKGLIKLATNTGLVSAVKVRKVFENDEFRYQLGLNDILEHKPALSNPGKFIGCYAVVVFSDGAQDFRYVSKEEGLEHGKRFSKNFNSAKSTWKLDEEAMICKTAVRMVLKYVPSSPENLKASESLARAITTDERMESGANVIDIELAEEIPAPKPLTTGIITKAQLVRLHAIATDKKWPDSAVKSLIAKHGFESSKDITMDKYDAICDELEKGMGTIDPDTGEVIPDVLFDKAKEGGND